MAKNRGLSWEEILRLLDLDDDDGSASLSSESSEEDEYEEIGGENVLEVPIVVPSTSTIKY